MSFFRTVTVAAAEAGRSPHILTRLRAREIDGIIVKEVYDRATCEAVRAELEAGRHGLIRTDFPAKFAAFFYGINLNLTHPDLKEYFAEAPRFRDGLSRLFPGELDLESRLTRLMSDSGSRLRLRRGAGAAARPDLHVHDHPGASRRAATSRRISTTSRRRGQAIGICFRSSR